MSPVISCPTAETLRDFSSGRLPDQEIEQLEQHLRQCVDCVEILQSVPDGDSLLSALAAKSQEQFLENDVVSELIGRLKELAASRPTDSRAVTADAVPNLSAAGFDFLAPAQADDELGRLGGYRVIKLLGEGGMGYVFQAEEVALKRQVALKVMRHKIAANDTARERFLREAQVQAAIEHDHIIPIFQVGEDHGVPFLAMPLLKGKTLEEMLKGKSRLQVAQIVRIAKQVAEGLSAAHDQGLIHRDIKPSNLWVEPVKGGRVKILDFGLARSVENDAHLTQEGVFLGTPQYMAPEQAQGGAVDARCDLFSLGVVLYRMTTGELPFVGQDVTSTLMSVVMHQPAPVQEINPAIPAALSDLTMRLLEKDREKRPASAAEMIGALTEIERELASGGVDPRREDAPPGGDEPR
ncbi:MAG: serine/threonine-protein kinase, partial [Gemmataceae bacterium]